METSKVLLIRRFVVTIVLNLLVLAIGAQVQAENELTRKYISRPKHEINIHLDSSIVNSQTRMIINLNGTWQARKKGDEVWTDVSVPGAYDFEGSVEFKRAFMVDSSFSDHAFQFVALGINNRCRIFLNDVFLGSHEGGHTPFTLEIDSRMIEPGSTNEIIIIVDNTLDARHTLPLKNSPQLIRNYGGIFRDVFIRVIPATSIEGLRLNKTFNDDFSSCQLSIAVSLRIAPSIRQNGEQLSLNVEAFDPDTQRVIVRASEVMSPQDRFHIDTLEISNLQLWTPDVPNLYLLQISLLQGGQIVDELKRSVGFNEFQVRDQQFRLNGQPILLKGVDWFEDYGVQGPCAGWNTTQDEILRIKELGANFVRVVSQPPHPYFLEMCDKAGLLVFLEIPLQFVPKSFFNNPDFVNLSQGYLRHLVSSASRYSSVAAWGLGSDYNFRKEYWLPFLNNLIQNLTEFSGQPVYLLSRFIPLNLPQSVDFGIVAFNNWNKDELAEKLSETNAKVNKPLVLSAGYYLNQEESQGFSRSGVAAFRGDGLQTAEERQAFQIGQLLSSPEIQEKVDGISIYSFNDWREARPNLLFGEFKDPAINRTGLFDLSRNRRIAGEAVHAAFMNRNDLKLPPPIDLEVNPNIYPIFGLSAVLLFLFNFHRSRRLRGNLRRIFLYPHGFYQELLDKRKVGALHTFLLSLMVWTILSVILSSILFHYRQNAVLDGALNLIIVSEEFKSKLVWLIWNPLWFLIVSIISFAILHGFLAFLFKITSFVLGKRLTFNQFFSLISWSNACFIWLLPIIPIYYRIINQAGWIKPAVFVLGLFFMWAAVRLFRALRVLYSLTLAKAILLTTILLLVIVGGLGLYYDTKQALYDYIPIYWKIVTTGV